MKEEKKNKKKTEGGGIENKVKRISEEDNQEEKNSQWQVVMVGKVSSEEWQNSTVEDGEEVVKIKWQ